MKPRTALVMLLSVLVLCGCEQSLQERAQLAVASCSLPVERELALKDDQTWQKSQVSVDELDSGHLRVSAVAVVRTAGSGDVADLPYVCEVEPDAQNERGFRVVSLEVRAG